MERSVVFFFELDVEIGDLLAQRVAVDAEIWPSDVAALAARQEGGIP